MDRKTFWGCYTWIDGVALRKESVDRKPINVMSVSAVQVALRKESVDRKSLDAKAEATKWVALRKESVDRKLDGVVSGAADYGRSPQGERG